METAEIILADTGLTPEIDQGLLEIALGDFEGEREADLRDRMGEAFDHWRGLHFTKAAPNGESIFDAIKRLGATLASVGTRHSEENVLLVAHQGINMAIMSAISGRTDLEDLANFRQRNDQVEVWDLSKGVRLERFEV